MNRIHQLRIAKGIESQRELAQILTTQLGVPITFATISRLESGDNENPRVKTAYALAKFFDVSIEYLMGYSDDRHGDGRSGKKESSEEQKEELPAEVQIAMDTF